MTTDNPTLQSEKLEPPDRISINPAVAARYPVEDKRIGDIEYIRAPVVANQNDDERPVIDVTTQHDFIQIADSDRCGLRGCTLGVLEHAWIPPLPSPASSPVPPEALSRASKLCRSMVPGARVELIFQNLQDAQAVHKWLCNLNTPAATSTPVEGDAPRSVQHLVKQACWLSIQDISRDSEADLVRRIEKFIGPSPSVREAAEEIAAWIFKLEQPLTSETDLSTTQGIVQRIIERHCSPVPAAGGDEDRGSRKPSERCTCDHFEHKDTGECATCGLFCGPVSNVVGEGDLRAWRDMKEPR